MDFGWFLDGFRWFWMDSGSLSYLGCTCASYPPSYISTAYLPGSSAFFLLTVPRMHMCILSPELQILYHIYQAHLPSISPPYLRCFWMVWDGFWVDSRWILDGKRFRIDFGWILDRFPFNFVWILVGFLDGF